jgi:hypothetical protein
LHRSTAPFIFRDFGGIAILDRQRRGGLDDGSHLGVG